LALRDHLLTGRDEQLQAAAEPLESHSTHMADSASDELDHDLALAELSAEQDALYEVDEAIRRILNGTYGVCEVTGKRIPASRLRAAPWTRFSREAQERLERSAGFRKGVALGPLHPIAQSVATSFAQAESPEEEPAEPTADDEALHVLEKLPVAHRAGKPRPKTRTVARRTKHRRDSSVSE